MIHLSKPVSGTAGKPRLAVIGAGPAGLTSAKQALACGYDVTIFEKYSTLGGIWNPDSGGAYRSVRMQSSRMSFPFSDFPARHEGTDFLSLQQMHSYLIDYANHFNIHNRIRYGASVNRITKHNAQWTIKATTITGETEDQFDFIMVASGELWQSRVPDFVPTNTRCRFITAKQYQDPTLFRGQKVLVVGGGVSGADIAAELSSSAASVEWSIRRPALFLPRDCEGIFNDAMFSYIGRSAVEELSWKEYLQLLDRIVPRYMQLYRQTEILPKDGFHNAIHINEYIVPLVHEGKVRMRRALHRFETNGEACFIDGQRGSYDAVVLCLGYGMPDYSFIEGFSRQDLYEHFIYRKDPTLAVINTPVDTEAFGTACPYFEAIAAWALQVFSGNIALPDKDEMLQWCLTHMNDLNNRRFYDCWRETIRLGLINNTLPNPTQRFAEYWTIVSSQVVPANLVPHAQRQVRAHHDAEFDHSMLKARILATIPTAAQQRLFHEGQITADECAQAERTPVAQMIAPELPYRMRYAIDESNLHEHIG